MVRNSTSDEPARIYVTLENTGSSTLTYIGGETPPFSEYVATASTGEELFVIPDEQSHLAPIDPETGDQSSDPLIPEDPIKGHWCVDYELLVEGYPSETELQPGESIETAYTILGRGTGDCIRPSEYRCEETGEVRTLAMDVEHSLSMGFTLVVDEDHTISIDATKLTIEQTKDE